MRAAAWLGVLTSGQIVTATYAAPVDNRDRGVASITSRSIQRHFRRFALRHRATAGDTNPGNDTDDDLTVVDGLPDLALDHATPPLHRPQNAAGGRRDEQRHRAYRHHQGHRHAARERGVRFGVSVGWTIS